MDTAESDMWLFFTDAAGKQQWQWLDERGNTLAQSHQGFNDRYQCVEDARRYGYVGRAAGLVSP